MVYFEEFLMKLYKFIFLLVIDSTFAMDLDLFDYVELETKDNQTVYVEDTVTHHSKTLEDSYKNQWHLKKVTTAALPLTKKQVAMVQPFFRDPESSLDLYTVEQLQELLRISERIEFDTLNKRAQTHLTEKLTRQQILEKFGQQAKYAKAIDLGYPELEKKMARLIVEKLAIKKELSHYTKQYTLSKYPHKVTNLELSPDGKLLAISFDSATNNSTIILLEIAEKIKKFNGQIDSQRTVLKLCFNNAGNHLYTCLPREIYCWDLIFKRATQIYWFKKPKKFTAVSVSPTETHLAIADTKNIKIFDLASKTRLHFKIPISPTLVNICFNNANDFYVANNINNKIHKYSIANGRNIAQLLTTPDIFDTVKAFCADTRKSQLYAATKNGTITIWDSTTDTELKRIDSPYKTIADNTFNTQTHDWRFYLDHFTASEHYFYSWFDNGTLNRCNKETGEYSVLYQKRQPDCYVDYIDRIAGNYDAVYLARGPHVTFLSTYEFNDATQALSRISSTQPALLLGLITKVQCDNPLDCRDKKYLRKIYNNLDPSIKKLFDSSIVLPWYSALYRFVKK